VRVKSPRKKLATNIELVKGVVTPTAGGGRNVGVKREGKSKCSRAKTAIKGWAESASCLIKLFNTRKSKGKTVKKIFGGKQNKI